MRAAREALRQLPCPSFALSSHPPTGARAQLSGAFDVRVASREELTPLLERVAANPLASLALVQLLRLNERLDVHESLVAESLVYSTLQSGPEFAAWRAGRPVPRPRTPNPEPPVRIEREADRLRLTLNRPDQHNAFSLELRDALVEALELVVSDPSIREVTLRGAGASFCSGGDLDEFGTCPDPATAHGVRSTRNAARLLAACAARVRAEVHGACIGAGVELPAFASYVVAHEDAFFQLPELQMGLVPGSGGTVSLPRRIGRQRSAYLALSGDRLDAKTAQAWGLVDELSAGATVTR